MSPPTLSWVDSRERHVRPRQAPASTSVFPLGWGRSLAVRGAAAPSYTPVGGLQGALLPLSLSCNREESSSEEGESVAG